MPFALIIFGILFIVVGYRGTQDQFFTLLKGDFTGTQNFFYWLIAVFIVGAVGYIPKLKNLSNMFLALIILVLFISNAKKGGAGGFFAKFNEEIKSGTTIAAPTGAK